MLGVHFHVNVYVHLNIVLYIKIEARKTLQQIIV